MTYDEAIIELKRQLIFQFKLEEWHADTICNSIRSQTTQECANNLRANHPTTNMLISSFAIWGATLEGNTYWYDLYICLPDKVMMAKAKNAAFLIPPKRPVYHINIMD